MLIGLDKQTIKPTVVGVDLQRLRECANVVIDTTGMTVPIYDYREDKEQYVSHINIVDGIVFNRLTIGSYKADLGIGLFCYLDISKMGTDDCNLVPYTVEGFKVYTDKCIKYIEDRYGIKLHNNNYKGEAMEMNVTIELTEKFNNYSHLLELMAKLTPSKKRYKAELYYDKENDITGIKLRNKSMTKKVYDKRKQMETEKEVKIVLDKEYMRIEDTLLHQDKIKNVFNTYNIADITDEAVKEYMQKSINEDLIKPIEKHIKEGNKVLKKIAAEEKKKDCRKWKRMFLYRAAALRNAKEVPIVVDIQQILDVIKAENPKNYNRDVKKLQKDIEELGHLNNNFKKLSEIKNKCLIQ
jgi:hypothetical protein